MKRIFSQLQVDANEQASRTEDGLRRQRIRMINSLAHQMDQSNAITFTEKEGPPDHEDKATKILEVDIVVMTLEEARFLMKHARDVTSDELDMALKLQEDAKHLFANIEDIPPPEEPRDQFGRTIISQGGRDL
jgi:hypothetical protein